MISIIIIHLLKKGVIGLPGANPSWIYSFALLLTVLYKRMETSDTYNVFVIMFCYLDWVYLEKKFEDKNVANNVDIVMFKG